MKMKFSITTPECWSIEQHQFSRAGSHRWEAQGTDFPALLANQILALYCGAVIVSIRDFLPLPTERNENSVRC